MFKELNINPFGKRTGDCTVRAIGVATGQEWDDVYLDLAIEGLMIKEMPSDNDVWPSYLRNEGFVRHVIPDTCPDCYTIRDFAEDHPKGRYIVATGSHVVAVIDGDYYDTWDSGDAVPIYYYAKENENA